MDNNSVSLVLPFYNEEASVEQVVSDLAQACRRSEWTIRLVCVQNGSRDRTGARLQQLAQTYPEVLVVEVPQNQGYGYGIQQGLLQASGEIVGYMDGDGQILPEDMLHVLGRMKSDRAAKAVRVWRGDGGLRQVVSWCYNRVFKILFRIPQRDVNAKPKFMRRADFLRISPISKDWFIDPEVMIKAAALGISWVEVPVEFRRRSRGQSSVRVQTALEFFRNLIRWRFGGQLPAWRTKLG